MRLDELAGLRVLAGDELLERGVLDPPLAAPADLDRREVTTAHEW